MTSQPLADSTTAPGPPPGPGLHPPPSTLPAPDPIAAPHLNGSDPAKGVGAATVVPSAIGADPSELVAGPSGETTAGPADSRADPSAPVAGPSPQTTGPEGGRAAGAAADRAFAGAGREGAAADLPTTAIVGPGVAGATGAWAVGVAGAEGALSVGVAGAEGALDVGVAGGETALGLAGAGTAVAVAGAVAAVGTAGSEAGVAVAGARAVTGAAGAGTVTAVAAVTGAAAAGAGAGGGATLAVPDPVVEDADERPAQLPERDFSRSRGAGHLFMLLVAIAGALLAVRNGHRLGAPTEMPGEVFPESWSDTLLVISTLLASLILASGFAGLAGRRWARRATRTHPFFAVLVGSALSAALAGLVFVRNVVPFDLPLTAFDTGRSAVSSLVADLAGETAAIPPAKGGDSIVVDGLPGADSLAASLDRKTEACRDLVGRDTGSVALAWTYRATIFVPVGALAQIPRPGSTVSDQGLPVEYLNDFRIAVGTVLTLRGWEIEDFTTVESVHIAGRLATADPGARGRSYLLDASVGLSGDSIGDLAALDANMSIASPCLRPGR